jgi:hypothetical protein
MGMAFERGLWPGVDGHLSARPTYGHSYSSNRATALALVTFAVGTMISFLAKVHGQSALCHGQSFARNSRFPRTLGGRERAGHGLDVPILGISAFGLRASSGSDQPGRSADWMIGGDLRSASGRADFRAVPVPVSLL